MAPQVPATVRDRLSVLRPVAPYLLLVAISVLVHWTYLVEAGRPFYVDSNLPLSYADFAGRYFQAWNANLGHLNFAQIMRVPYVAPLYAIFRGLGVDVDVFVTVLFWLPTALGMVTGYACFRRFLQSGDATPRRLTVVCVLLGVLYGLSPWITKHYLHYYFRVSYAVLPVAFLLFVRYVHAGRRRDLVLTGLSVLFVGMNPHFLVYFFLLAGLFALVEGVLSRRLLTTLGRSAAVAGLTVAFSLFWLLPFLFRTLFGESVIGYNVGPQMVELLSQRSGPVNLFSQMAGFWHAVTERSWWLFDPLWVYQTVFLAIAIAAIAGVMATDRDDRFALFSGVTLVVVLALATGYRYGGPVADLYDLLLQLPFHGVFRAPARLQAVLPLVLGYLIGRAAIDGDRAVLRGGVLVLLVVACVGVLGMNLVVFGSALAPTELPEDHEHVAEAGYEDAFVSPPRPLGGYNPDWMFAREGGIVDSWDAHLFARPDTRQHYLNYYVFELLDRNRTATAVDVLRKSGANHFVVRTDTRNRRGVPRSEVLVDRLDGHLSRVYAGDHLVVFDLAGDPDPFGVVRPVQAPRDVDAVRPLADEPGVYPTYDATVPEDPLLAELNGTRRFHPANTFRRANEMDGLSRPPTYAGVQVRGERTIRPPASNGTLSVRATPLNRLAEVVRETDDGRTVHKLRDGIARIRLDLDGRRRPVTIRGPVYVERLTVENESTPRPGVPVPVEFHDAGTLSPDRTEIALNETGEGVELDYEVRRRGLFPQASFEPETRLSGRFTVDLSVSAAEGGDRIGLVLLRENGSARLYPTHERLAAGRQNVTVHVPDVPDSQISRLQLAVFPSDKPRSDQITIHDVAVTDRTRDPPVAETRATCDVDPTRPRCEGAAAVTGVDRHSPTRYEVAVNASTPYALHFGESYDSLWTAEVAGPEGTSSYGSRPLLLATNGFWINETGQHTVTVRYRPQRWFEVGLALSALAVLAALGIVLRDAARRRVGSTDRYSRLRGRLSGSRSDGRDADGRDRL